MIQNHFLKLTILAKVLNRTNFIIKYSLAHLTYKLAWIYKERLQFGYRKYMLKVQFYLNLENTDVNLSMLAKHPENVTKVK